MTTNSKTIAATIHERGNGFPGAGDYVPGDDGELYQIVSTSGRISTHGCGAANTIEAEVELADWDDVKDTDDGQDDDGDNDEAFPALAVLAKGEDEE